MSAVLYPIDDAPEDRKVAQLRVPPNSIEAESSVLGALLVDNGAWDRVGDLLTEGDFYRHEHRLVFAAIGALVNATKPADVVTVYEHLQHLGKDDEVGGLPYLNALAQSVVSAANVRRYAQIVRERSVLRQLVAVADRIATKAFNTGGLSVDAVVDQAMQEVMAVSSDVVTDEWVGMEQLVTEQLDRIQLLADNPEAERGAAFVPTGLPNLDDLLDGGLRAGQFIVIAARPSMGKSAIGDNIGYHIALNEGLPVAKFSMEMTNGEGAQRALASVGRIPLQALRRPSRMSDLDWDSLTRGVELVRHAQFYSNDRAGLTINQIRAKARALHRRVGKLGLILVDYFQLIAGLDPRQNRNAQLEEASRGLKALAKELGCPVVALAQVLRSVEKEGEAWEKQIPRMSDLKDCGSLEQDADIILMLVRPTIAQKGLGPEWNEYARGELVKQRGGRTGSLHFAWEGKYTRYTAWPEGHPVPTSPVRTRVAGGGL
jgi:replicative DNA helicase